jgi:hypothetical protein
MLVTPFLLTLYSVPEVVDKRVSSAVELFEDRVNSVLIAVCGVLEPE